MKLAFSGKAKYADYSDGYRLYLKREKKEGSMDCKTYSRVIRRYCEMLAEKLFDNGFVDLPCDLGMLVAARIQRKPQYRGKKFVGFGKMDYSLGHYDGNLFAFGLVYLPKRGKKQNLRSYGFVANRQLFKRIKARSQELDCNWQLMKFNDDMI